MLNSFRPDSGSVIGQLSGMEKADWSVVGNDSLHSARYERPVAATEIPELKDGGESHEWRKTVDV